MCYIIKDLRNKVLTILFLLQFKCTINYTGKNFKVSQHFRYFKTLRPYTDVFIKRKICLSSVLHLNSQGESESPKDGQDSNRKGQSFMFYIIYGF